MRKQEMFVKQEWMCFRTFCSSSCWFSEICIVTTPPYDPSITILLHQAYHSIIYDYSADTFIQSDLQLTRLSRGQLFH